MNNCARVMGATAALTLCAMTVSVSPASAAHKDGVCEASQYSLDGTGEMCLYYNSGQAGSVWDWRFSMGSVANFDPPGSGAQLFIGPGAGQGQLVKNNAASAWNRFWGESVYVYYNSNFAGPADFVGSRTKVQLNRTYNENASMRWTE